MRERIYWNRNWEFTGEYSEAFLQKEFQGETKVVELPHTVAETPFHYFDESIYQMVSGYRRGFVPEESWRGKQVKLTVEAAAHQVQLYIS